jgi:predicted P-loop ATPase
MTTATGWGATPAEWRHFGKVLDLTADLLPVVSNPDAKIATLSKMKDLGKTPSIYNRAGEVVGIPAWTAKQSTEKEVAKWVTMGDYGIALQTRLVRAIDIDINDKDQARIVREMISMAGYDLPVRYREDSGKCLLIFVMAGGFNKRVLHTPHGAIEFLANGQQFIAAGTHKGGQRYQWATADGESGLPMLVVLTPAEFEALWAALAAALGSVDERVRQGVLPSIPRMASQSWGDQMVPWLQENGWVREYDRDGRVHINCPWQDQHTTDTAVSATTYFPAGVGGFGQGHFRCLHAHCTGRSDQQFLDAMGLSIASEFEPIPAPDPGPAPSATALTAPSLTSVAQLDGFEDQGDWPVLYRDKKGIVSSARNVMAVMERPDIVKVRLCYDAFKDQVMVAWPKATAWRPMRDTDYIMLRAELERVGFINPAKELARDAALWVAQKHQIDSAIQWAQSLQWDGVPRVETFFHRYLRALNTPYSRAVGLYLWTALAGRCLEPGVKADMVPVFISKQGTGKTSVVEALAPEPDAFVEIDLSKDDEKLARSMRGKLVGEIAELRGLQGRDAEANKAWITRRFEEWTPKWHEYSTRLQRRLLFIGTGNKEFLDDETGERRWLPLHVGAADLPGLHRDVQQLWAEGVALFEAGGVQWRDAEALAVEQHAAFKVTDPWQPAIEHWLAQDAMDGDEGAKRGDGLVRAADVLTSAVGLSVKEINRAHEMRVTKVLARLGYEKKATRVGDSVTKRWIRADGPEAWRLAQ